MRSVDLLVGKWVGKRLRHGWMFIAGALATGAQADILLQPLALGDRAPLAQMHGLPAPRAGELLGAGQTETRLLYDIANNFVDSRRDDESLLFDGETQRLEFGWRAGLGRDWEVGITVPLIQHSGGELDGFIEGWHDVFGLPDGGRPQVSRGTINYRYERGNTVPVDIHYRESGVGDVALHAAYALWRDSDTSLALAATIKLPTGDADRLTGTDSTATDLTLAASSRNLWGSSLYGFANIGMLWDGEGEVLSDIQRDAIWHTSVGIGWPVTRNIVLKLQLDLHRAYYESALRPLGETSKMLVIGGTAQLTPHWLLDIAVGEDIHVDTAPDVTMQMGLRHILR